MTMADMEKVPGGDLKHCMKMISIIPFLWRCYIELVIVKDHHGHLAAKMQGLAVSPVKALEEETNPFGKGGRVYSHAGRRKCRKKSKGVHTATRNAMYMSRTNLYSHSNSS